VKVGKGLFILIILLSAAVHVPAQEAVVLSSRMDYYTSETRAELLIHVPESLFSEGAALSAAYGFRYLIKNHPLRAGLNLIPFDLHLLSEGRHRLFCRISGSDSHPDPLEVDVVKRRHKPNEVKIDRATGGLIVEGRPFFPFGFYCYSPVQKTLAEEEVVQGFNMMSPYQQIDRRGRKDRRRYMDRCAELGMKVHYNLLSLTGGGGVGRYRYANDEAAFKKMLLTEEILAFRDHPALLAWYISDEPTGTKTAPEDILDTYRLIKALDPYHPISIVFMNPRCAAEYRGVMDLVMADPYPVPNRSVEEVGRAAARLRQVFSFEKPVWIVPQAFGGNEWWPREPTRQEIRVMTYLALINGAAGIQYFIRHGRNAFPKSTAVWAEAGALAREAAEITPFLFSADPSPALRCRPGGIRTGVWTHGADSLVLAVNTRNVPNTMQIESDGFRSVSRAAVLFENREVPVDEGVLSDMIDAFGTRAYLIEGKDLGRSKSGQTPNPADPGGGLQNLILNSGFEDNPSAGTPSGCYIRLGGDRGAAYFVDSILPHHGRFSLRLNTPFEGGGVTVSLFPVTMKRGRRYRISLWARTQSRSVLINRPPRPGFIRRLFPFLLSRVKPPRFRLTLGGALSKEFELSSTWRPFSASVFLPGGQKETVRINPTLTLISAGTAWFDDIQLVEDTPSGPEDTDS
jgi:hypothetical protein